MPRYTVQERSFIGGAIVEPGSEVDYDGEPGPNLKLIGEPKKQGPAVAPLVAKIIGSVRMKAASRGVAPEDVVLEDVLLVVKELTPPPSKEVLAQVAKAVGVDLNAEALG